ncbi:MAG TPA: thioredoxin family protein [Acidobacteriota bacterium]|nr:thioredoxin family protein [Acidobacteriota bacterium]
MLSVAAFFALSGDVRGDELRDVPVNGMVTMLDLGAKSCIPCKMMAPILQKLEKVFRGKAAIVFIDVWEHNDQVRRFGLHAIPTQIFYDKDGKEVYRHVGFMSEEAIIGQLKKMGVDQSARQPQPVD